LRAFSGRRLVFRAVFAPAVFAVALAAGALPARADVALNIIPTFDSSITGDANAAAIEGTINQAISFYESTFTTHTAAPIGVTIKFQEGGGLGGSSTGLYKVDYSSFINALTAAGSGDATDTTALTNLPTGSTNPVTGSTKINGKSAELRALGFSTPGFVSGTFDGVITLNTSLTTPGSTGSSLQYSLLAVTEHEIDEVLGLGSDLPGGSEFFRDPAAEDLFRYTSSGARSYTTNSSAQAFFSLDGTTDLAQFDNQNDGGDFGDWQSNPLPGGVAPKVQDAFATPGSTPFLTSTSPESIALDAMGYNLAAQQSPVPEPTSLVLFGSLLAVTGFATRRRTGLRKN
jgi:hypothetical protein